VKNQKVQMEKSKSANRKRKKIKKDLKPKDFFNFFIALDMGYICS